MNQREVAKRVRRTVDLFVFLVMTIGCCLPALGQTLSNKQLSRLELRKPERSELIKRFQLFVEYEKTQSYDKQFELLAKEHVASVLHMDVTRESYVRFKQQTEATVGKLLELRVKTVRRMPDHEGGFNFSVVVKLQNGKTIYSDSPIFAGYLVNGSWYFSLVYVN
jgi:hypothetical protein